jgi:hypothetical protein
MALPTSGQISLNDLHVEAGGVATAQASFNDTDIRGLIGKAASVQMAMSEWYGAKADIEFVTSSFRQCTFSSNNRIVSLTGLGIQAGDLVIVQSIAQGLGDVWTGSAASGWVACDSNQGNVNFQTSFRYYKVMGSTVDTQFSLGVSEQSWIQGFSHPALVVVFRNTGTSPTNTAQYIDTSQRNIFDPGGVSVANSDSLHIIVGTRAGGGTANAQSGWTYIGHDQTNNQFGSTYYNSVNLWYKLGVSSGTSDIGTVGYTSYARINSAQLVFN